MTITPLVRPNIVDQPGNGLGAAAQAVSVLADAALSGGATWDSSTNTLSATVGITNNSASNNWDEPYLSISSITVTGGTVTVQAVNTGTLRNSSGSAITSGGAGSKYGLADIPRTGHNYALQKIAFSDPSVVSFSFVADVIATEVGSTTVINDVDDDTWNLEPFAQAAGGDCTESTASSPQITCTTPPSGSGCDVTCPPSTGTPTCPTGGTTDNCCVATSTSSSASNTCPTTSGTTCSCDQTYTSSSGTVSFDCQASTDCNVRVDGPKTANVGCGTGANCALVCTKTGTTTCNITACTSATCSVTIETSSGSAASVNGTISACTGNSTCTVNCANQADCSLSCGSTTATCTMTGCNVAKTCVMSCPTGQVPITCTTAVGKKICAVSGTTC
ncbi:MAG: hypothetical protein ACXVEF_19305 [Polyangiales bacterium]